MIFIYVYYTTYRKTIWNDIHNGMRFVRGINYFNDVHRWTKCNSHVNDKHS